MSEQKQRRQLAINRAKESISKLPIISRNVTMVNEKLKTKSASCTLIDDGQSVSSVRIEKVESSTMANVDTFN
jgi:hypothetical protein